MRDRLTVGIPLLVLGALIILPLVLPRQVSAAASLRQAVVTNTASNSSSVAATFGSTPVAGDLIIVVCGANGAVTYSTPSGGFSTAINEAGTASFPAQGIFYRTFVTGDSTTLTCATAGAVKAGLGIHIYDYSGIEDVTPFEAANTSSSTGTGTSPASGSVTTNNTTDLLFAAVAVKSSSAGITTWLNSFTSRSNFTLGAGSAKAAFGAGDFSTSATGTYSTSATGPNAGWRGQIAAFKISPAVAFNVDIVNGSGVTVGSPSVSMTTKSTNFTCQTSTGTLGTASQKIRVTNTTPSNSNGWTLGLAATSGSSATWAAGAYKIDYNDASGSGCTDGDSDGFGGQLTVIPTSEVITPEASPEYGCTNTGVSPLASSTAYTSVISSITIASAGSTSSHYCYWDITGLSLSQKVPAVQHNGSYDLGMTLTLTAL